LKLWKIWQTVNDNYDTFDSAVVATETEVEARAMHPNSGKWVQTTQDWARPEDVQVIHLGEAAPGIKAGVIVGSFNAG
jgi:hypothetical protein